ncbi:MAG: NAD-dependent epimerase/dehydratase family protein [Nitrososphaerales archaeon]
MHDHVSSLYSIERMNGASVLITGGMGFIGSNLARYMLGLGCRVTVYDSIAEPSGANQFNLAGIIDGIEFIKADVCDIVSLTEAIKDKDIIFNCAAQVSHTYSMIDPYKDVEINCKGMLNILEATRKINDKAKIVYTATRSQIGRPLTLPVGENHVEFPLDIYSANKSVAEKYHLIYHTSYGMHTTSVRLLNTYGPRAQIKNPGFGVINYFIGRALLGKEITVYKPGTQLREVNYVDDVIDALVLVAQSNATSGEIFNLGSDERSRLIDIVKTIVEISGSGSYVLTDSPSDRMNIEVGDIEMDFTKISNLLGWSPRIRLEEGLSKTIEYYKQHLHEYIEDG